MLGPTTEWSFQPQTIYKLIVLVLYTRHLARTGRQERSSLSLLSPRLELQSPALPSMVVRSWSHRAPAEFSTRSNLASTNSQAWRLRELIKSSAKLLTLQGAKERLVSCSTWTEDDNKSIFHKNPRKSFYWTLYQSEITSPREHIYLFKDSSSWTGNINLVQSH